METLLIEKEDELRVEEEKKYYAEDVQIQTDMVGRDIMALQYAAAAANHTKPKNLKKSPRMTVSGVIRSGTTVNQHDTHIILDTSPMVKNEFLGTEGSPLQKQNMNFQQSSMNSSPYAVITGPPSEVGQFQSSHKKEKKMPKKNIISSI